MKDWKWASERGWPERICSNGMGLVTIERARRGTHDGVEVGFHELFVEVPVLGVSYACKGGWEGVHRVKGEGVDEVHVVQAGDLRSSAPALPSGRRTYILMPSEMVQQPTRTPSALPPNRRGGTNALELPQRPLGQDLLLEHLGDLYSLSVLSLPLLLPARTFLIATDSPVTLFFALQTTPYAPGFGRVVSAWKGVGGGAYPGPIP